MTEKHYLDFETLSYYDAQKEEKNVLLYDRDRVILAQKVVKTDTGNEKINVAEGKGSVTLGHSNINAGKYSFVHGLQNECTELAPGAFVGGKGCKVGANNAHANYAVALGRSCQANNYYAFSAGHSNVVNGEASASFGHGNIVEAKQSFVSGSVNTVGSNALNCFVAGASNRVQHAGAMVLGAELTTDTTYETLVGYNNSPVSEGLLVVGNGFGGFSGNAFAVLRDGRAKVYTAPKEKIDVVRKTELDEVDSRLVTSINNSNTAIKNLSDSIILENPTIALVYDDRANIASNKQPTYGPEQFGQAKGISQLTGGVYTISALRAEVDPGYNNCYLKIYAGDKLVYHIGYDETNPNANLIPQKVDDLPVTYEVTLPYLEKTNDFTVVTNSPTVKFTPKAKNGSEKFSEIGLKIDDQFIEFGTEADYTEETTPLSYFNKALALEFTKYYVGVNIHVDNYPLPDLRLVSEKEGTITIPFSGTPGMSDSMTAYTSFIVPESYGSTYVENWDDIMTYCWNDRFNILRYKKANYVTDLTRFDITYPIRDRDTAKEVSEIKSQLKDTFIKTNDQLRLQVTKPSEDYWYPDLKGLVSISPQQIDISSDQGSEAGSKVLISASGTDSTSGLATTSYAEIRNDGITLKGEAYDGSGPDILALGLGIRLRSYANAQMEMQSDIYITPAADAKTYIRSDTSITGDLSTTGNIVLGGITLTPAKLQKLLDFIDTIAD
jgi:hypothetical protein